jgi:hypothetical protein
MAEKKREIHDLVKELGGDCTEDLAEDVTHFLIAAKPEGMKYRAAKEWKVPIVSLAWLEECAAKKCKCWRLHMHRLTCRPYLSSLDALLRLSFQAASLQNHTRCRER